MRQFGNFIRSTLSVLGAGLIAFSLCGTGLAASKVDETGTKLTLECSEISDATVKERGTEAGGFIKAEDIGCVKSLDTIQVPAKSAYKVVTAGLFLIGTTGEVNFGTETKKRYSARNVTLAGLPTFVTMKSRSGIGAKVRITKIASQYSSMATETPGVYTFGLYGHVKALVPTDGGVGYSDIESIEIDWSGVTATGEYGVENPDTHETTWTPFSFTAEGTSVIHGEDLVFTTRDNTSSGHCRTLEADDYDCRYADSYKDILRMANVSDVDGKVSCSGAKEFAEKNPGMDIFVCKKGETVIDCSQVVPETLVCKNPVGQVVPCSEVYDKNACYTMGKTADEEGYNCFFGSVKVSCRDAGYGDGCDVKCTLRGAEVSCDDVIDLNDCGRYGITPDALGYVCEHNGIQVPCSSFGTGVCAEKSRCFYGSDAIACSRYQNAKKCGLDYEFRPSDQYVCRIGTVAVSCAELESSAVCDKSPLKCYKNGNPVDCAEVANWNACEPFGETVLDHPEYTCRFDDVAVSCAMANPTDSSSCPLSKLCALEDGRSVDCAHLDNASDCEKAGYGSFIEHFRCSKGTGSFACGEQVGEGACDITTCAPSCAYGGVTLDGTANECVCLGAPVCSSDPEAQTGTEKCPYGGTAKGDGTRDCVCNPMPDCVTTCEWQGKPKADGTLECDCNTKEDCSNTMICAFGGVNRPDGSCECDNTPEPSCSGEEQYEYYGVTRIDATTPDEGFCTYGGICTGQEEKDRFVCSEANCPYGANYKDAEKNGLGPDICPYGHEGEATVYHCATVCQFGHTGLDKVNKRENCECMTEPVCEGPVEGQSGLNTCEYGGTAKADGTHACACFEAPNCASRCQFGGTPKKDGTNECACNEKADCTDPTVCAYGGSNRADGTCMCFKEPKCTGSVQTGSNYCAHGGHAAGDGTRACVCVEVNDCSNPNVCAYGGTSQPDGTCVCDQQPVCTGPVESQTGTNKCENGGVPKADGTMGCQCNETQNCTIVCPYGGTNKADGTCECNPTPNCADPAVCAYGGHPKSNGTNECMCDAAPNCAASCPYGGEPKADGTQDCACAGQADCADPRVCPYGGTNTGDGSCLCDDAPVCSGVSQTGMNYCADGGVPKADGTRGCECEIVAVCSGEIQAYYTRPAGAADPVRVAVRKGEAGFCDYGGEAGENGTCVCNGQPDCSGMRDLCLYGATPKGDGSTDCSCNAAPICEGEHQTGNHFCPYGGRPKGEGTMDCICNGSPEPVCEGPNQINYRSTGDAIPVNAGDAAFCDYGGAPTGDGGCVCFEAPACAQQCPTGVRSRAVRDGTQECECVLQTKCTGTVQIPRRRFPGALVEVQSVHLHKGDEGFCDYGGTPAVPDSNFIGESATHETMWSNTPTECVCAAEPDCSVDCPQYGGAPKADGTDACECYTEPHLVPPLCNGPEQHYTMPNGTKVLLRQGDAGFCAYGGEAKADATCGCAPAPMCDGPVADQTGSNKCAFGGEPKGNGSTECECNPTPNCAGGVQTRYELVAGSWTRIEAIEGEPGFCLYGGVSQDDGTCACNTIPDCSTVSGCAYGSGPKADGTATCVCNEAPVCTGLNQTGTNHCPAGGTPKGDGTMACECEALDCSDVPGCVYGAQPDVTGRACECLAAPDCTSQCTYGGTPKGNGTQECECSEPPQPNCSDPSICPYGGTFTLRGCSCWGPPNCSKPVNCPYGGVPKANGTSDCACDSAPVCTGDSTVQTGSNKCQYGGTPSADGTQACSCYAAPSCASQCPAGYGYRALGNGTQDCQCIPPPPPGAGGGGGGGYFPSR